MMNHEQLHRVVYRHDWMDPIEWATAIGDLADLTDDELEVIGSNTAVVGTVA